MPRRKKTARKMRGGSELQKLRTSQSNNMMIKRSQSAKPILQNTGQMILPYRPVGVPYNMLGNEPRYRQIGGALRDKYGHYVYKPYYT